MSTDDAKYLESFPNWLRTLGEDCEALVRVIGLDAAPDGAQRAIAAGLNYVFKSIDLIPDGIDDIGYIDDAFVMRLAASQGLQEDPDRKIPAELRAPIEKLADEAQQVLSFLGDDFGRLDLYVRGLRKSAARGRTVEDIVTNAALRSDFVADVHGFAKSYETPSFTREEKTLIKLRAFFDAKLPR